MVCIFDNHLTWKLHITFLLYKFCTACFFIRLTHVLGNDAIKNANYLYFHSLIKYGITFWTNSTNTTKVFLLQKWMIRIMMGVGVRCSCRGLLKKLHILPVPCAHVFSLMMFTVNNLDNYRTNSVVHGMHTRTKH